MKNEIIELTRSIYITFDGSIYGADYLVDFFKPLIANYICANTDPEKVLITDVDYNKYEISLIDKSYDFQQFTDRIVELMTTLVNIKLLNSEGFKLREMYSETVIISYEKNLTTTGTVEDQEDIVEEKLSIKEFLNIKENNSKVCYIFVYGEGFYEVQNIHTNHICCIDKDDLSDNVEFINIILSNIDTLLDQDGNTIWKE